MKAFLNCLIISQHENRTSGNKNRIRRYRYTDFSLILYCKNIYIIFSSDIKVSYCFSNPLMGNFYFKYCMRSIYFHIIKNVIVCITDRCPFCHLFFRINYLVCAIT